MQKIYVTVAGKQGVGKTTVANIIKDALLAHCKAVYVLDENLEVHEGTDQRGAKYPGDALLGPTVQITTEQR